MIDLTEAECDLARRIWPGQCPALLEDCLELLDGTPSVPKLAARQLIAAITFRLAGPATLNLRPRNLRTEPRGALDRTLASLGVEVNSTSITDARDHLRAAGLICDAIDGDVRCHILGRSITVQRGGSGRRADHYDIAFDARNYLEGMTNYQAANDFRTWLSALHPSLTAITQINDDGFAVHVTVGDEQVANSYRFIITEWFQQLAGRLTQSV